MKEERSPSVGEIVDYFLDYCDFPRRTDIVELTNRLIRFETLLKDILAGDKKADPEPPQPQTKAPVEKRGRKRKKALSATDAVLQVLEKKGGSVAFKEILEKTGFDDKKVRNIVFRLNKLGRIVREDRGTYTLPG